MENVFDFHLHPGYDFHDNVTDPEWFVRPLKERGITGCAGSYVNRAMYKRPVEEFELLLPELNQKAWDFHDAYPDFFVPGIHIHPDFPEISVEEMKKHKEKGGILVGEMVYYMMGFQYSHPNLPELLQTARDLGLVVNFHPSKNMALNRVVTSAAPGLVTVIAHLDGYGLYEDFLELMTENEWVYTDLSAYGASRPGMLRDAVRRLGSERILYGTDFPGSQNGEMQTQYVNYVLSEGLSEEDSENILFRNAKRLLKLS